MPLHVNYEVRWKNFRGFEDTEWRELRPLTILLGPNNSGKSSIIAPILLMGQTMASRDAVTPLITRGPLIDVGGFKDIIHNHDISKPLSLGFRYHVHDARQRLRKVGAYPPGAVEVTLQAGEHTGDLTLEKFELADLYRRPLLSETYSHNAAGDNNLYTLECPWLSPLTEAEVKAVSGTRPVNFLFSPGAALYMVERTEEQGNELASKGKYSRGFSYYISALSVSFEEMRQIFNNLTYIGPLRERLKRYYEMAGEVPISVGTQGEHMANMIRRRLPEFRRGLNRWIKRFEFGTRIKVENLRDSLFALSVEGPRGHFTNVADIGFGASQVLPLIVQALAARRGSLTVAEQPEIHLNPRLQGTLADLFVEMANTDHRVVVETHSEHLVLRVRRLVASGEIDHEKVAMYFVEKDAAGVSHIRSIPVKPNGSTEDWPHGFFEETLKESLALAAAQSRTRESAS
jgi:predicted ATPase